MCATICFPLSWETTNYRQRGNGWKLEEEGEGEGEVEGKENWRKKILKPKLTSLSSLYIFIFFSW